MRGPPCAFAQAGSGSRVTTSFEPQGFGRYVLVDKIAVGGMAEVFKAKSFSEGGFEKLLCIKWGVPMVSVVVGGGAGTMGTVYEAARGGCPGSCPGGERVPEGAASERRERRRRHGRQASQLPV